MDTFKKLKKTNGLQKSVTSLIFFCSVDIFAHYIFCSYLIKLNLSNHNEAIESALVYSLNYFAIPARLRGVLLVLWIAAWCRWNERVISLTKTLHPTSLIIAMVTWIYIMVKLLRDSENNPGFETIIYWVGLFWACSSMIIFYILWYKLCCVKLNLPLKGKETKSRPKISRSISRSLSSEPGSDSESERIIHSRSLYGIRRRRILRSKSKEETEIDESRKTDEKGDSDYNENEEDDDDNEKDAFSAEESESDDEDEEEDDDACSMFDRIWRVCIMSVPELPYIIVSMTAILLNISGDFVLLYFRYSPILSVY